MRSFFLMLAALLAPVPAVAQDSVSPLYIGGDTSALVTKTEMQGLAATIPVASSTNPPSVADSSAAGAMLTYARADHTHASKARKARVLVPATGTYDVVFPTSFTNGVAPLCVTTAETTAGDTNVVNSQIDGPTTATGFRMRVTRTAQSVVALLGLTILSVPTQVATYAHYVCIEP